MNPWGSDDLADDSEATPEPPSKWGWLLPAIWYGPGVIVLVLLALGYRPWNFF